MARISKGYDERLTEFLVTAQKLFMQKGYEQTSVNDIIEEVGVAKGTFYHYFKSKEDLLDKLVERFTLKTLEEVQRVTARKDLDAIEKLNLYFSTVRNTKVENKDLMKLLIKVMYTDENLRFRHKMFKKNIEMISPEFAKILEQGKKEGVLDPIDHTETATLIFAMGINANEKIVDLLRKTQQHPENVEKIVRTWEVYQRSVERVLGARQGILNFSISNDISSFQVGEHE